MPMRGDLLADVVAVVAVAWSFELALFAVAALLYVAGPRVRGWLSRRVFGW